MLWTSTAYAMGTGPQAGAEGGAAMLAQFAPLIIMFVIFYFLLIRPQQKRAKQHKAMLDALKVGDQVVTAGGIYGRIAAVDADVLTIDLGDAKVRVGRSYITGLAQDSVASKDSK